LDERILIEQLKKGEETAFRTIVEKWQDMVYNTALGIVQNAEDAEDISQEAFVQVYQSIHSFKGESKFSTWLYRITIAKALDHERRKKRKKRFAIVKKILGNAEDDALFRAVLRDLGNHRDGPMGRETGRVDAVFAQLRQAVDDHL